MKEKLQHKLLFTLGDWSDDGHGKKEEFRVKSNKTKEDIREAHFKFKKKYFDIGELCSEYDEYYISNEEHIKVLKTIGVWDEEFKNFIGTRDVLNIWLKALQYVDKEIKFEIKEDDKWEDVHFGGYDDKGRHLEVPGYGLFD